jgi:hypothetical protein
MDLQSFVNYAYARKGQWIKLKKTAANAIANGPNLNDAVRASIEALAKKDVLLAVPKQMLLAAFQVMAIKNACSRIKEACLIALGAHPATRDLVPGLRSRDGRDDQFDRLLHQVMEYKYDKPKRSDTEKRLSVGHAARLRANITGTVALWAIVVWEMKSDTVLRSLYKGVWSSEARRAGTIIDTWRFILDVRTPSVLGRVCDPFASAEVEAHRDAKAARASEAAALKRAADLEKIAALLRAQVDQGQRTIEDLRQAVRDVDAALIHARDDYERLRTRMLRRLIRETELLGEGLLAINRDPPKHHVMADHVERALSGLREEIKALQGEAVP